jgi:hypothetical protein
MRIEDHGDPLVDERWRQMFVSRTPFERYKASMAACDAILSPSVQYRISKAARFAHNGHDDLAARERMAAGYR